VIVTFFDAVVVVSLISLAWRSITVVRLQVSIVTFLPYGLLMALAWARLGAPDVAIAEAAIGGGLTSALLLVAARRVQRAAKSTRGDSRPTAGRRVTRRRRTTAALGAITVAVALMATLWVLPADSGGLRPMVEANLEASGVGNPVTAVLLNFRAYDTMLEIAVLVLALIGVGILRTSDSAIAKEHAGRSTGLGDTMFGSLVRLFLPVIVVTAGYLLWRGADDPGGAFQAGAVLAGGGVIAVLAQISQPQWLTDSLVRFAAAIGLIVFVGVGVLVVPFGYAFLEYPRDWSKVLILVIEMAATVTVASILLILFTWTLGRGKAATERGDPS